MARLNRDNISDYSKGNGDYSAGDTSYSPFFSNIGLEIHADAPGITKFWLHYNRFSRVLWNRFADFGAIFDKETSSPEKIVFGSGAELAFFGTDRFMLSVCGGAAALLQSPDEALLSCWCAENGEKYMLVRGYSKNGDARDPDEAVPFMLGIRAVKGRLENGANGICALPENGSLLLAFAFEALETDADRIKDDLFSAPEGIEECAEKCLEEIKRTVKELDLVCSDGEALAAVRAINGLTENMALAPGQLKKHRSSYPSRGYSSHFLWDTCFQNLAYEQMDPELAEDFLLQFKECQRTDGKYPQFLCSTWSRPGHTQPALIGWAAMRLYKKTGSADFIREMLPSLKKNNEWWLNNRMTEHGVIACAHGLETGQDDSPRFDNGATLSCDMNSYLLSQLNITASLCEELGQTEESGKWREKAAKLSQNMLKVLYHEDENIFYDAYPDLSPVKIKTPVSLLPLWAGVELPEDKARGMIEQYLISPEYLFGDIPFPSVAYNEPTYEADHWWRGPTWMSEAWLMLETLRKFGYENEYNAACDRLFRMMLKDGKMHELFNSKTGEGMGYEQQGWTCAAYIALLAAKQ